MISELFGYQTRCFANVKKAYDAYQTGDIKALSDVRNNLVKETVVGVGKLAVSTLGEELVDIAVADTPVQGLLNFISCSPIKVLTAAATVVNGVATVAASAVVAVDSLSQSLEEYQRIGRGEVLFDGSDHCRDQGYRL